MSASVCADIGGGDLGTRKNIDVAASDDARNDRQFIRSLARGIEVLRAFRAEDRGLTNAELSRRTGFPKPTMSRLTFTLLALGYLHMDEETGRYFLHPHILTLGYPVLRQLSIREIARPLMQELADSVRGVVSLAIRNGAALSVIIIERARHRTMSAWPLDIGVSRDMATTSLGRAYVAALDADKRQELMDRIQADDEEQWPVTKEGLEAAMVNWVDRGYVTSVGEWMNEWTAVGVSFKQHDGTILTFSCGGFSERIDSEKLSDMGERLSQMVQELARIQGDHVR